MQERRSNEDDPRHHLCAERPPYPLNVSDRVSLTTGGPANLMAVGKIGQKHTPVRTPARGSESWNALGAIWNMGKIVTSKSFLGREKTLKMMLWKTF
jgi:hypothetical protein